jgi:formylmethanofuran dehydrogenase subunit B
MSAWIRGQAAAFDAAVEQAAQTLAAARSPLIAGLAADVDALRAAFSLGASIGASFDPADSERLYADLSAWAASGGMATTQSELLARADLVVAVGRNAAQSSIVAMARSGKPTMGRAAGRPRSVLAIDDDDGNEPLAVRLGFVRALATGRIEREDRLSGLAADLAKALYGVAVYDPCDLGELGVEMLQGLAVDLNGTTRFFTLPIGDASEGRAALQVSLWTTGGGPRVGLGRGFPEHDPWRFDGARQVAAGETDAILWLSPLPTQPPAWANRTSVAIVGGDDGSAGEIVFSVAVPGESCDGVLFDERRGTLALRCGAGGDPRPRAAQVLSAIESVVARRRSL